MGRSRSKSSRRSRSKGSAGLGLGPVLILFFLFIAAVFALVLGRSLFQLGIRIAIVIAFVGIIYVVWYQLAIRDPAFRMGTAGESTIILLFVAVGFLFAADPIANSLSLSLLPSPYYDIQSVSGQTAFFAILAALFVLLSLAIMLYKRTRKRK